MGEIVQPAHVNQTQTLYKNEMEENDIKNTPETGEGAVKVEGNINQFLELEEKIVNMLRTVYDPEIPVNVYDLGMIYRIDVDDQKEGEDGRQVTIQMTLTAPNCPAADFIVEDVTQKVDSVEGVSKTIVQIVFEPLWDQSMMSDEAKLELGLM